MPFVWGCKSPKHLKKNVSILCNEMVQLLSACSLKGNSQLYWSGGAGSRDCSNRWWGFYIILISTFSSVIYLLCASCFLSALSWLVVMNKLLIPVYGNNLKSILKRKGSYILMWDSLCVGFELRRAMFSSHVLSQKGTDHHRQIMSQDSFFILRKMYFKDLVIWL